MKESKTKCENNDNFEIVSARCDSQACFESREGGKEWLFKIVQA